MDNIEKLKEKVAKDPTSKLFVPLAEEYRKAGKLDEAIRVLKAGLEKQPSYMSARVALGKIYIEKNMLAEAKEELEKVVSSIPDNLFAQRKLADIYRDLGQTIRAVSQYKTVLKLNPMDEEALVILRELEAGAPPPSPEEELKELTTEAALEATMYGEGAPAEAAQPTQPTQIEEWPAGEAPVGYEFPELEAPVEPVEIEAPELVAPVELEAPFEIPEIPPEVLEASLQATEPEFFETEGEVAGGPETSETEEEPPTFTIDADEEISPEALSFNGIPDEEDAYVIEEEAEAKPGEDALSSFGAGFAFKEDATGHEVPAGGHEAFETPSEPSFETAAFEQTFELPSQPTFRDESGMPSFDFEEAEEAAPAIEEETPFEAVMEVPEEALSATVSEEGIALADSHVARGNYGEALRAFGALLRENPEDRAVIQRVHELRGLLKMLGKDKEIIIARLEAFLEALKKRRHEFLGNT